MKMDAIKMPTFWFKLIEVIFVVTAFWIARANDLQFAYALVQDLDVEQALTRNVFSYGVLVCGMVTSPALLIAYVIRDGGHNLQKTLFEAIYGLAMSSFLFAAGGLMISAWMDRELSVNYEEAMTAGSFCIVAATVYLADCVKTTISFVKSGD